MDAVDFLKTVSRMCSMVNDCLDCPIEGLSGICNPQKGREGELVNTVEKWAKEHPVKTRLSDFLEKYPNAPLNTDGIPELCAEKFGYKGICNDHEVFCYKCWHLAIE